MTGDSAVSRQYEIVNKRGLHARASVKFVQTVSDFDAEVQVAKDGIAVGGLSIMGLMMLAAGIGSEGPGPLVTSVAGRSGPPFPIPVTIVPGDMSDEDIAAVA